MKIGKSNGQLVTREGEILTNYVPKIIAVVREHGCMAGVIINHPPKDCVDEEEKK